MDPRATTTLKYVFSFLSLNATHHVTFCRCRALIMQVLITCSTEKTSTHALPLLDELPLMPRRACGPLPFSDRCLVRARATFPDHHVLLRPASIKAARTSMQFTRL